MKKIDLASMSLADLKDLLKQVTAAIANFDERKQLVTLAKLRELARVEGFILEELIPLFATRKRAPSKVTYANPANPADTWSGRGRKPRWFTEVMNAGQNKESLLQRAPATGTVVTMPPPSAEMKLPRGAIRVYRKGERPPLFKTGT